MQRFVATPHNALSVRRRPLSRNRESSYCKHLSVIFVFKYRAELDEGSAPSGSVFHAGMETVSYVITPPRRSSYSRGTCEFEVEVRGQLKGGSLWMSNIIHTSASKSRLKRNTRAIFYKE